MESNNYFDSLDEDSKLTIFEYLDSESLKECFLVCKR